MFQKKNSFHILLNILIAVLTLVDSVILLGFFGFGPFVETVTAHPGLYSLAMALQIPIIYVIIYKAYIAPIEALKQGIARFYTEIDDEPNFEANSWSRGMNDVITFFKKSLQILKVFKSELRDGRKLRSEVEIAADIQKQSLSKDSVTIPGLDVAAGICSASEVGGDSLDVIVGQE